MPLHFHILDISSRDAKVEEETETQQLVSYEAYEDAESDDEIVKTKKGKKSWSRHDGKQMIIHLFGSTADGRVVKCDVKGFQPYFYLRIPDAPPGQQTIVNTRAKNSVRQYLDRCLGDDASGISLEIITDCSELFGFQNGRTVPLLKLTVPCTGLFYDARKLFLNKDSHPQLKVNEKFNRQEFLGGPFGSEAPAVYEANLDPMLRFLHVRNISPCGWVTIEGADEDDLELECGVEDIEPCTAPPKASAPFRMLSWDIECMSEKVEQILPDGTELRAFPQPDQGDPIIQIGCILTTLGTTEVERHIFVLGGCAPLEGIKVHTFRTERDLVLKWCEWCADQEVDIFMGYNIFGFDERYLWKRCESLGISESIQVQQLNRLHMENSPMKLEEKRLSSSAMGDNFLYLWKTVGRLRIDVFHSIKRNYALSSYKLDNTSRHFLSEKVLSVRVVDTRWELAVDLKKLKQEVAVGKSIVLLNDGGDSMTEKCDVLAWDSEKGLLTIAVPDDVEPVEVAKWAVVKDDVSPQELFMLHKGSDEDRAKIAKYCIQDCQLVLDLFKKLEIFNNAMSMANICSVPVSYIFLRGQGIKLESLIFKYCAERKKVIHVLPAPSNTAESYEGAIVLPPSPGLYTVPVGVADFASLYPSTIMSENISHDTIVWIKDYYPDGRFKKLVWGSDTFDGLEGVRYTDIQYDVMGIVEGDTRKNPSKEVVGFRICRYAQDQIGIIPQITAGLLAARKAKRKEAEKESDPFRVALLDAEQLAYKLTANSLYGQLGSGTFKVRFQALAASVTAYARRQIMFSKAVIEMAYGPESGNPRCSAKIIYGDTDSLFIAFHPKDPETGKPLEGRAALEASVNLTVEAGQFVTKALKAPHDFEFDKVYWPFLIFSKKRYVGYKYEDIKKPFVFTTMGVALKRRDYAPIVKRIYGGAIHTILNERDVGKAVEFVKDTSRQLVEGKIGMQPLIISKSLRAEYANPAAIAHKALADRIAKRTPGNAPAAGDRIPYVYILPTVGQKASDLQADRIETPTYIKEKGLSIDYQYYIDHQISNPVCQLFGQLLEQVPGYVPPSGGFPENETARDKLRESMAYDLLFNDIKALNHKQQTRKFVEAMFGVKSGSASASTPAPTPTPAPRRSPRLAKPGEKKVVQSTLDSCFLDAMKLTAYKEVQKAEKKAEKEKEKAKAETEEKKEIKPRAKKSAGPKV